MTAPKIPGALASFSRDWVGGDIRRLSQFAGLLYGYAPKITSAASTLDDQVSDVVRDGVKDAHWKGDAASAFRSSWDKDSVTAQAVAAMATGIGKIVDALAVSLSKTESVLEQNADHARSHGVQIESDGSPVAPASSTYATAYAKAYAGALQDAQKARETAVNALVLYNGPNHSLANKVFGTTATIAAEYALVRYGGLDAFMAGARVGGAIAETLAEATLTADPAIGLAIAAGSAVGFVAVPIAVGFAAYGVGVFAASIFEGKSVNQSLEASAGALATPFKDAAVGIGHAAEHVWDDIF